MANLRKVREDKALQEKAAALSRAIEQHCDDYYDEQWNDFQRVYGLTDGALEYLQDEFS